MQVDFDGDTGLLWHVDSGDGSTQHLTGFDDDSEMFQVDFDSDKKEHLLQIGSDGRKVVLGKRYHGPDGDSVETRLQVDYDDTKKSPKKTDWDIHFPQHQFDLDETETFHQVVGYDIMLFLLKTESDTLVLQELVDSDCGRLESLKGVDFDDGRG